MTEKGNINIDWLTRRTGDPFADIGGIVGKLNFTLFSLIQRLLNLTLEVKEKLKRQSVFLGTF